MSAPAVSIIVPTRNRAAYLEVALQSLRAQVGAPEHEVLVVDDGSHDATGRVTAAAGVRYLRLDPSRGANGARNAGLRATGSPLVVLIDDDIRAPRGWLRAYADGAERHPEADAFGGPIHAHFEGPAPRGCGREAAPITTLDLGPDDRETDLVWSANMALRRRAIAHVGEFDESIRGSGEESEWLERLQAGAGTVVYLAGAGLDHRRVGSDAQLRSLARAEYRRGRTARSDDTRRGTAPGAGRELRNLAGAGWHTVRRRCPQGLIMGAHSAGRLARTLRA